MFDDIISGGGGGTDKQQIDSILDLNDEPDTWGEDHVWSTGKKADNWADLMTENVWKNE